MSAETRRRFDGYTYDDRSAGLVMLGTIFYGSTTGAGVGVFLQEPEIGAMVGAAVGILAGILIVPRLLRDQRN